MKYQGLLLSVLIGFANLAKAEYPVHMQFERLLENELDLRQEIILGILHLQKDQAQQSAKAPLRGTHAKGVCAKAQFEILAGNSVGIFAFPGTYPATVRFANAAGKIQADQENDVRSLSFSVDMPQAFSNPQGRMDFSTNDATTFPINDADVFAALMTLARKGVFWGGIDIGVLRGIEVAKAIKLGSLQQRPLTVAYQQNRYWSGVPFLFGQDKAIKYSLKPCASNTAQPLTKDPNALSLELARHLNEDSTMSCFDFQVQFLDVQNMTDADGEKHLAYKWIENATWEWSEQQAPFHTVARLTLEPRSLLSDQDCEAIRINVNKNTNSQHRGLGSINRGRTGAEEESGKNR